jgi:hypothetical protein
MGTFESMNIIPDHPADNHFQFPLTFVEYHLSEIGGARQPELLSASPRSAKRLPNPFRNGCAMLFCDILYRTQFILI